jgi:hypothetical protein
VFVAHKQQLLDGRRVHPHTPRRLGNAEDRHPAVRSLGAISGFSVPCEERVVDTKEHAL